MIENQHRTIAEAYATAVSSSDLKCDTREGAPRSDSDVLAAAGWCESRIGSALLRLHTEYDGAEHPRLMKWQDFYRAPVVKPEHGDKPTDAEKKEHAEKQREAEADAKEFAEEQCNEHNTTQQLLMRSKLKTLPAVVQQVETQLKKWGEEDAKAVADAVVIWWLQQACRSCNGRKFEIVPGTARLSNKTCKPCGGTGHARIPHGDIGRRMANFLDDCVCRARLSISERLRATRH